MAGLAKSNLVHQGAELAYLLRHDPHFRGVRREHRGVGSYRSITTTWGTIENVSQYLYVRDDQSHDCRKTEKWPAA
jgi:hypothetical protein